jgi:glycosyltransferase involved in cell wall biosynthesis
MKICMVSTSHDASDDRLYFKEARSLAKVFDVTLLAPSAADRPGGDPDGLAFARLRCGPSKASRAFMAIRLLFELRHRGYDVIHLSDAETVPLAPLFKRICKAKVVCDIWEANYETLLGPGADPPFYRRAFAALYRWVENIAARQADLVLTADEEIARGLAPAIRATVIFNYPILSLLAPEPAALAEIKAKYGGARILIYHGSMSEERGILAAIEAMALVRAEHPTAKLLLVGRMPEHLEKRAQSLISRLELHDAVAREGWVSHTEVGKYLAISEVGIVPFNRTKKFEKNIPQKIFEYWAAGLPVVATDLPPIRRFVNECGGGLLTASNRPNVISAAICELLDQPVRAREMGERGKAKVESKWRWEMAESKLLSAYDDMRINGKSVF